MSNCADEATEDAEFWIDLDSKATLRGFSVSEEDADDE